MEVGLEGMRGRERGRRIGFDDGRKRRILVILGSK